MNRVKDKICVVTGGAFGIGRSISEVLAKEGARVVITDIKDDEGEKLASSLKGGGFDVRYMNMDVGNFEQVTRVMDQIIADIGPIDVLVNNAGISGADKPTHEITPEEWDQVMRINVNGVFYCTKAIIPCMKKNGGGSIINLSSIYGLVSSADIPPYHASKGAVRLMTKTDALFYAKDKIRVNSVHPGFIWTPLVEELGERSGMGLDEFRRGLADRHPLGKVGEPEDIAWGVLYLASDESKFVTGSELVIDGGYTAR